MKYIKEIFEKAAISGFESEILDLLRKNMPKEYSFFSDAMNNYYFTINKKAKKSIAIVAHIDETGFIVSNINENGTLKLSNRGGFQLYNLVNSRIVLNTKNNVKYNGILFRKMNISCDLRSLNDIDKYFADFGFLNKKDAKKHGVCEGDQISFLPITTELANNRILTKSVDNRASVSILLSEAEKIKKIAIKNDIKISIVFSSQEEVGLRGSKVISHNIDPDIFIMMDVSPITDTISNDKNGYNYSVLGKGPHIRILDNGFITQQKTIIFLEKIANKEKINFQYFTSAGGTDSASLSMSRCGYPVIPLTFGYRYSHGPSQLLDLNDLSNTAKFLLGILNFFNPKKIDDFKKF